MSVYAIHKIGFFYTDDAFDPSGEGTVVKIVSSLEEAQQLKQQADIVSLKGILGSTLNIDEFYAYHDNATEIAEKLNNFLAENFDEESRKKLDEHLSDEQAIYILSLLSLQFHHIIAYDNEDAIDVEAFENDEEETELTEF